MSRYEILQILSIGISAGVLTDYTFRYKFREKIISGLSENIWALFKIDASVCGCRKYY